MRFLKGPPASPPDAYNLLLPLLAEYLKSEEYVIHTYAASAIEQLLSLKVNGQPKFSDKDLGPHAQVHRSHLYRIQYISTLNCHIHR